MYFYTKCARKLKQTLQRHIVLRRKSVSGGKQQEETSSGICQVNRQLKIIISSFENYLCIVEYFCDTHITYITFNLVIC